MSSVREGLVRSAELVLPRRGFLGLLTGALVMPAIIKVAPLMRIKPQPRVLWVASTRHPQPRMMWYSGGVWNLQGEPLDIDLPPLVDDAGVIKEFVLFRRGWS